MSKPFRSLSTEG